MYMCDCVFGWGVVISLVEEVSLWDKRDPLSARGKRRSSSVQSGPRREGPNLQKRCLSCVTGVQRWPCQEHLFSEDICIQKAWRFFGTRTSAPGLPTHSLPLFQRQLITPVNISLQILAASQTSPHLWADCSRTFLPPSTTLLGPNLFFFLPPTCIFLPGLLFFSCADL